MFDKMFVISMHIPQLDCCVKVKGISFTNDWQFETRERQTWEKLRIESGSTNQMDDPLFPQCQMKFSSFG